jgi:hypothetical protein
VPPEVSGRAFLGLIRNIKDRHGPDALRKAVDASGPSTQAIFAEPIRILKWYPYEGYVGFLRTLQRDLGGGDRNYCRKLGAVAGERDLGTIFKIYRAIASAERLIRACNKIWPSYYRDAGKMDAISWEPENTVLRITDFKQMDPTHCRLMEGWMIATMAQIGLKVNDEAGETVCMSRGGQYHEFVCKWRRAK